MRVLFFLVLASAFIIGLIYELDHGLARGTVTMPEAPELKNLVPKPPAH